MSEISINVQETVENVEIVANNNVIEVNITRQSGGGGGAVDSVNGQTGVVVLDADDISDASTTKKFVSASEKTAITHSNRSTLDAITEAFTTALKTAYDSAVAWISTNGANLLNHLANTSNPHNTTAAQVGAPSGSGTSTGTNTGDQDLSGLQDKRIVVSTNTTAVIDGAYTLVASSTFTDPTPSEGKGYSVFIRNGTATIGAVSYSTVGTLVWRLFHSGSWATYVLTNQTQLNAKEDSITAGTTSQYYRGDKTFQTLDKTSVGLSNVDNTSDLNKPISTATQTALNGKITQNAIQDISLTSTIVGWASFTRREINILDLGNCFLVIFALEGVSNSASATFTVPFTNTGGLTSNYIRITNNSTANNVPGNASIGNGSSTVVLSLNNTGGVFTASGNKSTIGEIIIYKTA